MSLTILGYHHPLKHNNCRNNILRNKKTVNYFLNVFFQYGTMTLLFLRGYWKIIAMKLIYLPLLQQLNSQRLFKKQSLSWIMRTLKVRMTMGVFRILQRLIVSNIFLKALPECPTIHWPGQMFNDPHLCFCPCSTNTKTLEGKNESINSSQSWVQEQ